MDETEVIYGTIGMLPSEEYNPNKQYEILNLVSFDGSSYVVHTKPPVGTLPTDLAYWQVSALGTSKATANSVGTVKPDGVTTEVSADGSLSVKTATQSALGLVKGSAGIKVGEGGTVDVNTTFTQAAELANIIAGEAISQVLGKISKSIAVTMGLDQNALLKNMLTNIDANDQNKIPTSALVHTLVDRIGMGTELTAGANLTAGLNALNSDLTVTNGKVTSVENSLKTTSVYYDASKVYSATISWFFNRPVFFSADSWDSDYKNSCPILNQQWIVEYLPFEMSEVSDGEVVRAYQRWHAIENKEIYERWANNGVWSAFVKK